MPIEVYLAVLVASSCIVLLTVAFLVAAVYFQARVTSIERQVTLLEADLSRLINEGQELVQTLQQVAVRATGAMEDVGQITRTAAGWTDRADRLMVGVATITEPPVHLTSKYLRFGGGFLSGVMQSLLTQGRNGK